MIRMAGSASATPIQAIASGRSPITTPNTTGTAAPSSAAAGAATAIRVVASA